MEKRVVEGAETLQLMETMNSIHVIVFQLAPLDGLHVALFGQLILFWIKVAVDALQAEATLAPEV